MLNNLAYLVSDDGVGAAAVGGGGGGKEGLGWVPVSWSGREVCSQPL